MDLVHNISSDLFLDKFWGCEKNESAAGCAADRGNIYRQATDLYFLYTTGGVLMYLIPATLDYYFLFDHKWMKHDKWIPGQIRLEMEVALKSLPIMSLLMTVVTLFEMRVHSQFYDDVSDYGLPYFFFSIVVFVMFTDCLVYWFHRWLHLPFLYKHIHKPHHRWKVASPFASHAFHPIDGFVQGLPYHLAALVFPMHRVLWLCLFGLVNMWTVSIHDGYFNVPNWKWARWLVNGAAHHVDHHLFFNYNYGQYFTIWDRIGGSYMYPTMMEGAKDQNRVLDPGPIKRVADSSFCGVSAKKLKHSKAD